MSRDHVGHAQIQNYADRIVNLNREHARKYREQVHRLRDKLEHFLGENPDFELRKMLLSGSLGKHTALKTINDVDVALYVTSAPEDIGELTDWLARRLRTAFPNFQPTQVVVQNYSVKVEFRGTGLDVDVVPVYQEDDQDWGLLISQEDGAKLRTNITLHKQFIARRRKENTPYYAQVARLLKWWVKSKKEQIEEFKFKSFMIELVLAKLYDDGNCLVDAEDFPETMLGFFDYMVRTDFTEAIYFTDFTGEPGPCHDPIRVFDPVNSDNNVARKFSHLDREAIIQAAADAGDAIEAALRAPTKELTLGYWREVFGSSFSI